ncbi:unnamed protein product, partial [Oppiella nova]
DKIVRSTCKVIVNQFTRSGHFIFTITLTALLSTLQTGGNCPFTPLNVATSVRNGSIHNRNLPGPESTDIQPEQ